MYTPYIGLAQILSVLSQRFIGLRFPFPWPLCHQYPFDDCGLVLAINLPSLPLFTVSMSSLFIQFVPVITLTNDPTRMPSFGRVVMQEQGIGFALRNNISMWERILPFDDSKTDRKRMSAVSPFFGQMGTIMLIAGLTWLKYALYSMITIFVSSRVTDAVFTKQKKRCRQWS